MRRVLVVLLVIAVGLAVWRFWEPLRLRERLGLAPAAPQRTVPPSRTAPAASASPDAAATPKPSPGVIKRLDSTRGTIAIGLAGTQRSSIALIEADESGQHRYVLEVDGSSAAPVAWSPSGGRLLYSVMRPEGDAYRVASFAEGRDAFLSAGNLTAAPVWLDDDRLAAVRADALLELKLDGTDGRRATPGELGVCRDADCPKLSGVAAGEGVVAVTTDGGDVAVLAEGFGSSPAASRNPDEVACSSPHVRSGGGRVGVTCIAVPADYDPSSEEEWRNHYDFAAWIVDVASKRWTKVRSESGGHEWGSTYFPWSPDGSRYVAGSYSEVCSSFTFHDGAGRRVAETVNGAFGSFAPDGARVAFEGVMEECVAGSRGVFVADASLREPRRLSEAGYRPLWSPATETAAPASSDGG